MRIGQHLNFTNKNYVSVHVKTESVSQSNLIENNYFFVLCKILVLKWYRRESTNLQSLGITIKFITGKELQWLFSE